MLGSERAAYGEQIVVTVSRQLVVDYGRGYSEKNLRRMVQFAKMFPEQEIVATRRLGTGASDHSSRSASRIVHPEYGFQAGVELALDWRRRHRPVIIEPS